MDCAPSLVYGLAMEQTRDYWRLCSSCRQQISFGDSYYACSVSTCNRKRTFLSFCSVPCFQEHVPVLRHRDAWAEEKRAPSFEQWKAEQEQPHRPAAEPDGERAIAAGPVVYRRAGAETKGSQSTGAGAGAGAGGNPVERLVALNESDLPRDVLIVASKLKQYIRARSGMNTSDGVMKALSDIVRHLCDQAIRNAAADERKTVMDRDFSTDKLELDRPLRIRRRNRYAE